jgi:hypothetical protein
MGHWQHADKSSSLTGASQFIANPAVGVDPNPSTGSGQAARIGGLAANPFDKLRAGKAQMTQKMNWEEDLSRRRFNRRYTQIGAAAVRDLDPEQLNREWT